MPRMRRWVAVMLALALLAGCQMLTPKVAGRVLDADTGEPLAHAEIHAADGVYEADAEGRYALYLGAGDHELLFDAPAHASQAADVSLARMQLIKRMDVRLAPRKLHLTLTDASTGEPVPDASVQWGAASAQTDTAGAATLRLAPTEPLAVRAEGYLDLSLGADELGAALASEAETISQALTLTPRTLSGRVLDAVTGEGVAGATLALGERTAASDAEGAFSLAYLPAEGQISVQAAGYRAAQPLPYAGETQADIAITPWIAAVTVLDADSGLPVPEALVTAGAAQASSAADGLAQVHAEPGAMLQVTAEGYHGVETAFAGDPLTVTLKPSRLVLVLANSASGEPLANARVILYRPDGDPVVMRSDDRGHLSIDDALQYDRLLVKQPGYRLVAQPIERIGRLELAVEPFEARGIYIPFGLLALPDRVEALLDMAAARGLNMVTVDVKGDWAYLAWDSTNPIAREIGAFSPEELLPLPEFLEMCHERNLYAVARMVVFKDSILAAAKPDWGVQRLDGSLYKDGEGLHWLDPFEQGVRDYIVALAVEIAEMGFDEVQFDYVRFPSDGETKTLEYEKEAVFENRTALMAEFFQQAGAALEPTRAFFSADVFGLVVWMDEDRDMGIGQRVEDIAPYVDYFCPMLYPQTFGRGNLGYDNPQLYPYEVVFRSVRKTKTRTDTLVRAWLQHYSLGVSYDLPELLEQRKGAEDAGGAGWTYWNAAGKYNENLFVPDPYAQVSGLPTPEDVD
ncbi:MAG: putative glycoside hydrolase [Anaerolineae bacterium]|jgi:hypothetical protein